MKTSNQFLLTLFAWIMFTVGGFSFLRLEGENSLQRRQPVQPAVSVAPYRGTGDLKVVNGTQVIGMIPSALEGDYILYIDGIRIDENTDLAAVELRGVPGLEYQLSVTRDSEMITVVNAIH